MKASGPQVADLFFNHFSPLLLCFFIKIKAWDFFKKLELTSKETSQCPKVVFTHLFISALKKVCHLICNVYSSQFIQFYSFCCNFCWLKVRISHSFSEINTQPWSSMKTQLLCFLNTKTSSSIRVPFGRKWSFFLLPSSLNK